MSEIENTFADNWGIKESFRKKLYRKYDEFVKKYIDSIKADELNDIKSKLGCEVDEPNIDKFYKHLEASGLIKSIDLEDYIGKMVPSSANKYKDVKLVRIETEHKVRREKGEEDEEYEVLVPYVEDSDGDINRYNYCENPGSELERKISAREGGDLSILFQIRLESLYGKSLQGEWDGNEVKPLQILEHVMKYLPTGHCIDNDRLSTFDKESSFHSSSGYAFYQPRDRKIYFSGRALAYTQRMYDLSMDSGDEFPSVVIHEIGHAVSSKLHGAHSLLYRKFARACGWTWEELDKRSRHTYSATGNDKDTKRGGSRQHVELITDYAHKSPEEAFAEYYSFYNIHKKRIDQFLDKKETKQLRRDKAWSYDENSFKHTKSLNEVYHPEVELESKTINSMTRVLTSNKRDLEKCFGMDTTSPWTSKHSTFNENKLDKQVLSNHINFVRNDEHRPLFSIKNPDNTHLLAGHEEEAYLHYANKYVRKETPVFYITKEAAILLQNEGYSTQDIEKFTYHHLKDDSIISGVKSKEKSSKQITGLKYSNSIVPASVVEQNHEIFSLMRDIYYSDDLKKALEELFSSEEESIEEIPLPGEQSINKSSLLNLFKKHIISPIRDLFSKSEEIEFVKNKYADCLIFNKKGELLLLRRSDLDDFEPTKWCLPGGKIEEGESSLVSAQRELMEETNLLLDLEYFKEHENDECKINYYFGHLLEDQIIMLDEGEHYQYEWVDLNNLDEYDMILDLKDRLKEMIDIEKSNIIDDFDKGLVSEEEYFEYLQKSKIDSLKKSFRIIKDGFDQGLVTEEKYLQYLFKAKEMGLDLDDEQSNDEDNNEDEVSSTGHTEEELREHAANAPLQELERTIKEHGDSMLRRIAHEELDRRHKEEHVQEEVDEDFVDDESDLKSKKPINEGDIDNSTEKAKKILDSKGKSDNPFIKDYLSDIDSIKKERQKNPLEELVIVEGSEEDSKVEKKKKNT